jgi:hypothetical protein
MGDLFAVCNTVMTAWDLCPVCHTARHTAWYAADLAYRLHTPQDATLLQKCMRRTYKLAVGSGCPVLL